MVNLNNAGGLLGGVAAVLVLSTTAARADYTTTVVPTTHWGKWAGWGSSLAWWANIWGNRDDMADVVYTLKTVSLKDSTGTELLPGLGFNVARYNVGGTGFAQITVNGKVHQPNNPPSQKPATQIQTYWLNPDSHDPKSASWNWSVDANQRLMMQKAKARGANIFEMFSNSPPWWMCYNSSTAGSSEGTNDNLMPWAYQPFADYLAAVAKRAHDHWGIDFASVEPFNESTSNWWRYPGSQEGCHFDVSTQNAVIVDLREALNAHGLKSTPIAASDENTVDLALDTWRHRTPTARHDVAKINTHGYQGGGGDRAGLYLAARNSGKVLWNSEYGEGDASGLSLATNLTLDLRVMHPSVWCYWQPFDGGGWGLVQADRNTGFVGTPNPKYFVLAQFTRHIRPGMTMVDSGDANTVAAYNSAQHQLVLVTTNHGTPQWITYNLSAYIAVHGNTGGKITRWETQTGSGDKYSVHNDTQLSGKQFKCYFPANTVQTFVVNGVK